VRDAKARPSAEILDVAPVTRLPFHIATGSKANASHSSIDADAGDNLESAACVNKTFLAVVIAISVPFAPEHARTGLFSTYDTLELRLEAPFEDLFARAKDQPDYSIDGTLRIGGHHADRPVPVTIELRVPTSIPRHRRRTGLPCTIRSRAMR
jgi:hypothetical protein